MRIDRPIFLTVGKLAEGWNFQRKYFLPKETPIKYEVGKVK